MRLAVSQHLHALDGHGDEVLYHNVIDPAPRWLAWTAPDFCILHTTFLGVRWNDDFETYRRRFQWVSRLRCPKLALPQDEYDHSAVLADWLLELGASTVYSCFPSAERSLLYPSLEGRLAFRETLPGFIDGSVGAEIANRIVAHSERPFDIVYRAAKLQYWFGSHGQLKHRIAEAVGRRADELGLRTDISTRWEDTIFGKRWLDFVMSGRATIGCESGSSVLDPRGELQTRIRLLLAENPDLTFGEVDARMPPGWDSYAFFAISPRHLEAVVTKTAQILVEGRYSGVLEPERHYIPLQRNFSNLDEALERLRDAEAVETMAERAYRDVYLSGKYTLEAFADTLRRSGGKRRRTTRIPLRLLPHGSDLRGSLESAGTTNGGRSGALANGRSTTISIRRPVLSAHVRTSMALLATLAAGVARQPQLRRLMLAALFGRARVPLRNVVGDVIRLRVLARLHHEQGRRGEQWWVSVENTGGTIVLRTEHGFVEPERTLVEGPTSHVVWDHSAIATAVPLFPGHAERGWIVLGPDGRYEFAALGALSRDGDSRRVLEILRQAIES